MAKLSSKSAVIILGGYVLSPDFLSYTADHAAAPVDVTGFGEPQNFTPGLISGGMSLGAYWNNDAARANTVLKTIPQSIYATLMPEGYTLGTQSLSMYANHVNWHPQGQPSSAITAGTINLSNRGTTNALEVGWALAHATITDTTTGTAVLDPTDGAVTAACSATLHIWDVCATDTYVIKVQHCATVGGAYADLLTFTLTGAALGAERVSAASGTINKYRRVLATRTGSAGETLGYTVHFWHG